MNPYQRIIRGGKVIQEGHINTHLKFKQLTEGVDLKGKTFLDIGCNLGEMCRLAKSRGAIPTGIDIEKSYIDDAKKLSPDISFKVADARNLHSTTDIVLMSGTLHYFTDYIKFFERMSVIVNEMMILDVWLSEGDEIAFYLSHRNSFIPTKSAFEWIAKKYFKVVENKGATPSPDNSKRFIYHLKEPIKKEPKALLIYGEGGTGKSTLASEMVGYQVLRLDDVFIWWLTSHKTLGHTSVKKLSNESMASEKSKKEYLDFHYNWLKLRLNKGFDVVIEGYDILNKEYREMVKKLLKEFGYNIKEKHLTHIY